MLYAIVSHHFSGNVDMRFQKVIAAIKIIVNFAENMTYLGGRPYPVGEIFYVNNVYRHYMVAWPTHGLRFPLRDLKYATELVASIAGILLVGLGRFGKTISPWMNAKDS